ncbi:hypothetical protein C8J56DRAFT_896734 [Mycena floridula]|nr:hypothetical protein C8J56DRAFT_896734 [Mycena floridula]
MEALEKGRVTAMGKGRRHAISHIIKLIQENRWEFSTVARASKKGNCAHNLEGIIYILDWRCETRSFGGHGKSTCHSLPSPPSQVPEPGVLGRHAKDSFLLFNIWGGWRWQDSSKICTAPGSNTKCGISRDRRESGTCYPLDNGHSRDKACNHNRKAKTQENMRNTCDKDIAYTQLTSSYLCPAQETIACGLICEKPGMPLPAVKRELHYKIYHLSWAQFQAPHFEYSCNPQTGEQQTFAQVPLLASAARPVRSPSKYGNQQESNLGAGDSE